MPGMIRVNIVAIARW